MLNQIMLRLHAIYFIVTKKHFTLLKGDLQYRKAKADPSWRIISSVNAEQARYHIGKAYHKSLPTGKRRDLALKRKNMVGG